MSRKVRTTKRPRVVPVKKPSPTFGLGEIQEAYLGLAYDARNQTIRAADTALSEAIGKVRNDVGAPEDFIFDAAQKAFRAITSEESAQMNGGPTPVAEGSDSDE